MPFTHETLQNRRRRFGDLATLMTATAEALDFSGTTVAVTASWLEAPLLGGVCRGVLSIYEPLEEKRSAIHMRTRTVQAARAAVGGLSGALPAGLGIPARLAAIEAFARTPRYVRATDVLRASDRVSSWTFGDPARLLAAQVSSKRACEVFTGMLRIAVEFRDRESCLTSLSMHLTAIRETARKGSAGADTVDVLLVAGTDAYWMTPDLDRRLAQRVDEVCAVHDVTGTWSAA